MLGLFTGPTAFILCCVVGPLTVAPLPLRNVGEEAVIYCVVMIYFALAGAGAWSIDALLNRSKRGDAEAAGTA
jgi:putative oxidoreductase